MVWSYAWPVVVVVLANTLYNVCTKETPAGVNPFASLLVTYLSAAAMTAAAYFVTRGNPHGSLWQAMRQANWSSVALGFSILALEFGYIYIYRAGWNVSVGSLVANIGLACVLLAVGLVFYHEALTLRQVAGIALCGVGMVLLNLR